MRNSTQRAAHTVTATDIDAGIVENTAKAGGKAPDGKPVESNAAKAATTIEKRKPSIALVKTGTERVSGDDVKPGTEIGFRFDIENNSNATLKGIVIDDALDGIGDVSYPSLKALGFLSCDSLFFPCNAGLLFTDASASSRGSQL